MDGTTARKLEESVAAGLAAALGDVAVRRQNEDPRLPAQAVIVSARETAVAYDVKHAGKYGTQCELGLMARLRSDSTEETAAAAEALARRMVAAFEAMPSSFFSGFVICLADRDGVEPELNAGVREITARYRVRALLA